MITQGWSLFVMCQPHVVLCILPRQSPRYSSLIIWKHSSVKSWDSHGSLFLERPASLEGIVPTVAAIHTVTVSREMGTGALVGISKAPDPSTKGMGTARWSSLPRTSKCSIDLEVKPESPDPQFFLQKSNFLSFWKKVAYPWPGKEAGGWCVTAGV